jgi:hypothetical protein
VEVDADTDTDALDEIEGAVAGWLRGIGEPTATVNIDGRTVRIISSAGLNPRLLSRATTP